MTLEVRVFMPAAMWWTWVESSVTVIWALAECCPGSTLRLWASLWALSFH